MLNRWLTNKTKKWLTRLLKVAFASTIGFAICQLDFSYLESWFYDARVRYSPATQPSGHIKTIEINPTVVELLRGEPSAKNYSQLLSQLASDKPKAIIFLNDVNHMTGSANDFKDFARIASQFSNIYFSTDQLIIKGQEEQLKLPPPLDRIPVTMALITRDDNKFGKDAVTRRVILSNNNMPFIHHTLASMYNGITSVEDYKGTFDYLTSKQTYIDFRPKGTYKPASFLTVMQGAFDKGDFKDKIVLVGRNTVAEASDYKLTPYSRQLTAMSNLEVHANMIDTLIGNTSPTKTPYWFNLLLTILISILTVFSVFTLRPSKGITVLAVTVVSLLTSAYLLFFITGSMLNLTFPIFAIFICYYFFIPYRLIMENRRSWEYLQHNRMLSEVEELKTNFLRMMSHDLKTPLARIQGMTEVALREKENLSEIQSKALKNIGNSSYELTTMIESILNLNRIESSKVQLHLQSKDINTILQTTALKCQDLAKDKNIEIITEFEPLFSIKVDEALLSQVFTNLLENAIKYSPDNTKILISTEEIGGKLIIQVADQGFGIDTSDLKNVFEKFYRSKSDNTIPIKGTGLGLYLSKYFVNLHKGNISVESDMDHGSTFTVELPMN